MPSHETCIYREDDYTPRLYRRNNSLQRYGVEKSREPLVRWADRPRTGWTDIYRLLRLVLKGPGRVLPDPFQGYPVPRCPLAAHSERR